MCYTFTKHSKLSTTAFRSATNTNGTVSNTYNRSPMTFKGNRWALTAICLHTPYVFAIPMMEKSAENVIQDYLSGILAHKGRSVTILCDNGTEFKNCPK